MVDRYAKFAADNVRLAASPIENRTSNVIEMSRFCHVPRVKTRMATSNSSTCGRVKLPHLSRRRDAAKLLG